MQLRELRDSVAHRFISDAFSAVAAVNMGKSKTADARSTGSGKCFDAISQHDNPVRFEMRKAAAKACDAAPERFNVFEPTCATRDLHGNDVGDGEVTFDITKCECRRHKVAASSDDHERKLAAACNGEHERSQQTKLGAGARDHRDAACSCGNIQIVEIIDIAVWSRYRIAIPAISDHVPISG
ncbi:hypothetical protein LBMAG48_01200 [Phycisphaerae bacterium]|nr:hypothetical protein LBMAG48_01200 [Phycisphaerae bacterium]